MEANTPAEMLISRLTNVRQTRPDRWTSLCPAHDDRSPSLSISRTGDGTVLIKCWAGCGAEEIVKAVGLRLADLFPRHLAIANSYPNAYRFSAYDVVKTACSEAMILCLAYEQAISGKPISAEDNRRIAQAVHAITSIHREVMR